ncbi:MAG: hypothetical protein ACRD0Z_00775 [Acidimicrobiales bacterium]
MRWKLVLGLGAVLLGLGVTVLLLARGPGGLPGQVVARPAADMVLVETGAGSLQPTEVLPEPGGLPGVVDRDDAPVRPTIVLGQATNSFISHAQTEQAYWELWWDGGSQVAATVSLQQQVSASDAEAAVSDLQQQFDNTATFTGAFSFSGAASSTVPGLAAASGVLDGTFTAGGSSTSVQYRYGLVTRGSVVALVGLTAYGGTTSAAQLDSFAKAEYEALAGHSRHTSLLVVVIVGGVALLIVGALRRGSRVV